MGYKKGLYFSRGALIGAFVIVIVLLVAEGKKVLPLFLDYKKNFKSIKLLNIFNIFNNIIYLF